MLRRSALAFGICSFVGLGALAAPVFADTITFKNGHEVHGRLVEETDKYVVFQVGNGKLKFDKREIATFTEDADYGQRYFSIPKRASEPDNVVPGSDGKAGRTFYVPPEATPEERRDLKGVHARIDEELAKLGPSNDERARRLGLSSDERTTLDAAVANFGKVRTAVSDAGALGPKALQALADALQAADNAVRGDAASAVEEAVKRGDESDVKWALGRSRIATLLANALDASGDDKAPKARDAANRALETISSASNGWAETKDPSPTEAQRNATVKWKDWAKKHDDAWETANKESEAKRKKLNADWRDLDDAKNWRKALARAIDTYGTTVAGKGGDNTPGTPKEDASATTNPDIAKEASKEQLEKISELKTKIKKTLEDVVGLSIEDRKKKYAPSSDELQEMTTVLHNLGDARRRAGNRIRQNAVNDLVSKYGLKALQPLSEALDGQNVVEERGIASAVGQIVGADATDGPLLVRAYGLPSKLVGLLDFASDQKAAGVRSDVDKALAAIAGISMGWPADVTSQELTPEETTAKKLWADWVAKDASDFTRTEKLREENRKALTDLQKKLDSPRGWKDALEKAPDAISKAERDLKK